MWALHRPHADHNDLEPQFGAPRREDDEETCRSRTCERVDPVYQHANRLILVAGPEITVRPVATRVLTRDDAQ